MAKLKSGDATGGNADTAAAKAIQPDIDKTYGVMGNLKVLADVCSRHHASFRCGLEIRSLLDRSGRHGGFYEYTA